MTSEDTRSRVKTRRLSVASATLVFVIGVCAVILGLQVSRIVEQRAEALAAGKVDTDNLVVSLTRHADLTFRAADTILSGLAERLQAPDHGNRDGEARLKTWFRGVLERHPQIAGFAVADSAGDILINSDGVQPRSNVSASEYFRQHLGANSKLFIGAPIFNGESARWLIPVSRRYDAADGTFAGIVVAFLDTTVLQEFYGQFDIGRKGAILLMSGDNKLLVRRPFVEANVGRDMSKSNIVKALAHAPSGTVEIRATTDSVVRLNSYRRGEKYPFVIAVARSTDEMLAPWRSRALREAAQTLVLLLIIGAAGFFVWRMAKRLSLAKRRLDTAINAMPQGLCLFDADRRLVIANERFREMYRYPDALVRRGTPLADMIANFDERGLRQGGMTAQQYADGIAPDGAETIFNIDGRVISVVRKPSPDGGWVATHEDVTEHRRNQQTLARQAAELRQVNEYFECAINNMSQGICLFDADQRVTVANSRYAELYNLSVDQIKPGTTLQQILDYRAEKGTNFITAPETYLAANIKKENEIQELADGRTMSISRRILSDGGWLTTHEDITERRKNEKQIAYLAAHDPLTGLPNRASFIDALDKATADGRSANSAVFLLDLDRFKAVNDTLGHAAGDLLLKEVGSRLRSAIRENDIVARLGGDEFAIVQRLESAAHEPAISLALRIIDLISEPFELGGHSASIGTSIGIAVCPEQGTDRSELIKKADLALYAVKAEGRNNFRIFDAAMTKLAERQKLMETELAEAIEREQFELHYQPIADARTGRIVGAEALVRWNHPQHGVLTPDRFIALAEETGLIAPLGEWVLQQGCRDAAAWPDDLKISINLSAHQLKRGNLFDVVLCTLVESGLNPGRLELEISESALLDRRSEHQQTLRQLKSIGMTIVLDDCDTGYSSAQYLTLYPFDKIKIDKSFVQGMGAQRESSAIIASTLALAQGLDVAVTAEGIETQEQLHQLRLAGVDFVQGHLIGRPMVMDDFLAECRKSPADLVA